MNKLLEFLKPQRKYSEAQIHSHLIAWLKGERATPALKVKPPDRARRLVQSLHPAFT